MQASTGKSLAKKPRFTIHLKGNTHKPPKRSKLHKARGVFKTAMCSQELPSTGLFKTAMCCQELLSITNPGLAQLLFQMGR
jgi:hypothetical protein